MKKIISLLVCLVLVFSLSISAFAAESTKVNSNASANLIKLGDTITVVVSLSDSAPFKSLALTPNYDTKVFEMVEGEWLLKDAAISNFNGTNAAIAYTPVVQKNGDVFKYVLKVKDNATLKNTVIKTDAVIKNGASIVECTVSSVSVKVICKNHSFGAWNKVDNYNHKRICSACDEVETTVHNWDSGKVTKAANCKETGSKTFTCTACNSTKTESIAKTKDHKFGEYSVTKAPTCENKGTEERKCSVCSFTENRSVAASGHKFSNPIVTKEPTCNETGIESGKCTLCGKETTNTLAAKGHTFGEAVVTKEATETETGIKTKTCTVCNAIEEEEIPCLTAKPETPKDEKTDATVDADNKDGGNNILWIVIAIVAVAGVAIVFIIKKKVRL